MESTAAFECVCSRAWVASQAVVAAPGVCDFIVLSSSDGGETLRLQQIVTARTRQITFFVHSYEDAWPSLLQRGRLASLCRILLDALGRRFAVSSTIVLPP